jgi:phosphoglycerol transferase MdoB-like AlkP superfamily enzyme
MSLEGHYPYRSPAAFPHQQYRSVTDPTLNDYLNALHYMDGWIHDLIEAFRKRGLLDRTVFVILGDHGDAFGEHVSRQHIGVPYEEALRIPGLIYAPSLWPRGGRIEGLRQQIDVLPTIADALGYRLEGGSVPGRSLLQSVPADRPLFFMSSQDNDFLAMRQGNRKYIYTFDRTPLQAYDLARDPDELHDLADSLSPTDASAVTRRLIEWQQRTNSTLLSGVAHRQR